MEIIVLGKVVREDLASEVSRGKSTITLIGITIEYFLNGNYKKSMKNAWIFTLKMFSFS